MRSCPRHSKRGKGSVRSDVEQLAVFPAPSPLIRHIRRLPCTQPCTHPAGGHPSEVEGLSLAGELDSAVDAETGGVLGRLPCERP